MRGGWKCKDLCDPSLGLPHCVLLKGPSVTSVLSLWGLQPLSYRGDWALEGLHDEVITDKAGTA